MVSPDSGAFYTFFFSLGSGSLVSLGVAVKKNTVMFLEENVKPDPSDVLRCHMLAR